MALGDVSVVCVLRVTCNKQHTPSLCLFHTVCTGMEIERPESICLPYAGTGVGHIWLYNTLDWSCQRMGGGLLHPPVACCFCDWPDLTHHLFLAPGLQSAVECLSIPHLGKVCSLVRASQSVHMLTFTKRLAEG